MLDKRLNDKGKNWRHVFKVGTALGTSLLYILTCHAGFDTAGLSAACRIGKRRLVLQGQHLRDQVRAFRCLGVTYRSTRSESEP